jgi:hypothetical protein
MFPCKSSDQVVSIIHDARNDIFVAGRIKADTFSTGSEKEETGKYRKKFPETEGLPEYGRGEGLSSPAVHVIRVL